MGLTGMGGWASRFLKAGAGGFLGAYWSIHDEPALDFAKAFYTRLFAGDPVGKAARRSPPGRQGRGRPDLARLHRLRRSDGECGVSHRDAGPDRPVRLGLGHLLEEPSIEE